ncbi:MAG: insulinase family protein [Bacteroidetes bacterium]|nr:insulinase family protein [Bacteroidota bacterium]MBT6686571.1 insulinase family protein [Bacteroidota bacterium]MBT7142934.1 insulinase family protein [Bacteroidota bacterium]MBT7490617.1 insulinase family protein [Bacteroidota bacterium]
MKKKKLFFSLIVLFTMMTGSIFGQNSNPNFKLPIDPNVIYGKLENGLTYYIRSNDKPEDRAQFWLVNNVGAILEDDDQNGLAHFCEHMAFNGTKNFEKKDIINYLQRIGMKFGPEINAYTVHDVTNYMLQKVPIDQKENIDTSLMVLYDWAYNVSYEDEEIDSERGVIHEEWRTRRSANFRMRSKYEKVLFSGSKYAERDIIGDIDIIDNCPYDALKRFYKTWYRPDLQAIIAVGDFDTKEIEKKIRTMFSKMPATKNPEPRKSFKIPGHDKTLVDIQTDKEAQYCNVSVYYKHDPILIKNAKYLKRLTLEQLFSTMINDRLKEISLDAKAPFINAFSFYYNIRRTKDVYQSTAISKNNQIEESLMSLLVENERVKKHGFTSTELERAKKDYLKSMETAFNERNKRKSSSYASEYQQHFLQNDPIPGIEFEYEFAKKIMKSITVEEINVLAKKWITEKNRVVVVTGPDNPDIEIPSKEKIYKALENINKVEIVAFEDNVSNEPLFNEKLTPGKLISTEKNQKLGTTIFTYENGARVVIKTTDFKDDEILMSSYSIGGASLHSDKDYISASLSANIVSYGGLSNFDNIQLDKLLSDKVVNVNPWVDDLQEGINGSSSQADFETMLQMVHLYFTKPRIDETAFNSLLTRWGSYMENKSNDPNSAFSDSIQVINGNYHFRERPFSKELLKEADFAEVSEIYKQRFADPGSFTFFFVGNIDEKTAKPLLDKYIGALPKLSNKESWKDQNVRFPKKKVEKTFNFPVETPKSTVYVCYHNDLEYNVKNRLLIDAIESVLDTRYTETIREAESGSYGVGIKSRTYHYPVEQLKLEMKFDCDPEKAEKLSKIIFEEVDNLRKNGPSQKNLDEFKKNKIKEHNEYLKENRYWLNTLKHNYFHKENLLEDKSSFDKLVNSFTINDIKKAAQKYLNDSKTVKLVMKPE